MKRKYYIVFLILRYKILFLKSYVLNGFKYKVVLSYTQTPNPMHVFYAICHVLGYKISKNPEKNADVIMFFEDWTMRKENPILNSLNKTKKIININCRNISKAKVDRVFEDVFGYSIKIDPYLHTGLCVKKSNINAMHDGEVLQCPLKPEEGYVYQRLLDNTYNNSDVMDLRVSIMNSKIPMVIRRFRSLLDRFGNTDRVVISNVKNEFTDEEISKIISFSDVFGLDYGDLDILRDKKDGRIYIVDVNNTPYGPIAPKHLSKEDYSIYIKTLAEAFQSEFCI